MKTFLTGVGAVLTACLLSVAPARAELSVVASIPPVHSLVAKVMGETGTPYLILRGGQSPHGYALRPSDARALAGADLVFYVSPDVEAFLAGDEEQAQRYVELDAAEGVTHLPVREGALWGKHDDDHGHEDHGHDKHAQDHEGEDHRDPHVWLSPRNGVAFVAAIAGALAQKDPGRAAIYRRNAEAATADLLALSQAIAGKLAPVRDRPFLVFHDAYQYFEAEFDLNAAGAISIGSAAKPGARRVRELRERVLEGGIRCVFREAQFDPRIAEVIVDGSDARIGTLDPVGGSVEPGAAAYEAILLGLADGFHACLKD